MTHSPFRPSRDDGPSLDAIPAALPHAADSLSSIDIPIADRSDGDRNDVADVDCEAVDVTSALQARTGVEEHELDVPAVRFRAADGTALGIDRVELVAARAGAAVDELELERVGGGIVDGAL